MRSRYNSLNSAPNPWNGLGVFLFVLLYLVTLSTAQTEGLKKAPEPPTAKEAWLSDAAVTDLCAGLKNSLGEMETLQGRFTEYKYLSIFTEPVISKGRIYLSFPSSIRMETTEPFETVFIGRRKALTRWEKEDGEWAEIRMGSPEAVLRVLEQMTYWMRGDLCSTPQAFEVSAWEGDFVTMRLTPIYGDIQKFVSAIDVTLNEARDRLQAITIREANGDYTYIVYDEIVINPELPQELFQSGPTPWFLPAE